jgi:hypothetical protein
MTIQPKLQPGHDGEPQLFIESKDFVYVNGEREPVLGPENVNVDRISYLEHRGIIDKCHKEAARRFLEDCEKADIAPLATSPIAGVGGRTQRHDYHPSIQKIDAMRRKGAALKSLGPMAAHFIERVVVERMSAEKAGSGFGFNEKASVGALRIALDVLAAHYGLI